MKFIKRYWHHRWKLRNNCHDNKFLQNTWNKHGEDDFVFEVVEVLHKDDNMNLYEIEYIEKYDSYNNGFNLTTGGEGKKNCPMPEHAKLIVGAKNRKHNLGKKHSKETREKMRLSSPRRKLTKRQIDILRASRIGSKHTDEAKQKMREKKLGSRNAVSVINEEQAYEIKQRLIDGERIIDVSTNMDIDYAIIKAILQCKTWNHVEVDGWTEFIQQYNKNKKQLLSDDDVLKIRSLLKEEYTAKEISEICNIGISVVYGIKQNRTYKNVK